MSVRGLERIGDVLSSIGMTQQIIYYGMGWNSMGQQEDKDTHNNQPKTDGENGG
jgi:hypothetical protein